ncbi:MAG: hypothetical protein JNM50_14995 [Chromatiales bacterium]|jgi:hypothetical protein|nr:hypothetical protein [Chromatiales bacterium]
MSLPEFLYGVAFATYMVGVAWSLRTNGARPAVILLAAGAAMDFILTGLVSFGPALFSFGITGSNTAIQVGAILGVAVWLTVTGAIVAWWRGRMPLFYVLAVVGQLVWFVDYLAFLYGIHAYPLA